ncbi:hypothetical protein [Paraburkholderia sp. MM5477-R1]|uniref:hypothetical protein n=1 Tax=Paraburkholderia sp. MM5477-R1 TaxID=2991062 RepID=UPI003D1FF0DC
MKQPLPFQTLDYAADVLNEICRDRGLPENSYSVEAFLLDAQKGRVRLTVVLPGNVLIDRKNGASIPSARFRAVFLSPKVNHPEEMPFGQTFPKGAEHFYIDAVTAYSLSVRPSGVELRALENVRPDGGVDVYRTAEPLIEVGVTDLRISFGELRKYAVKLLAAPDDAADSHEASKPSLAAEPRPNGATIADETPGRASEQATDSAPPAAAHDIASATDAGEAIGNEIARIQMGRNTKEVMDAYIQSRARHIYANQWLYADHKTRPDTKQGIAAIIATEMERNKYRSDRDKVLGASTIVKEIPKGLTGGRAKNGKRR